MSDSGRQFFGYRDANQQAQVVIVRGESDPEPDPLPLRLDLANHSPDGFEWGYGGSGPAQLALAMCAAVLGDEVALRHHQAVKWALIAPIAAAEWQISEQQVRDAVAAAEQERPAWTRSSSTKP